MPFSRHYLELGRMNNQLPLSAQERVKGSLSDILPDLQDLVVEGRRKSFGATEQASLQGFRQFFQRTANFPEVTGSTEVGQGAQNTVSLAPGGLWGPIPALNLHSGAANQQRQATPGTRDAEGIGGSSAMSAHMAELMPYASFIQAQAGLLGGGNRQELWQRLVQTTPGMQQQLLAQLAQQSMLGQGLPSAVGPAAPEQMPAASQPGSTGSPARQQGVKRGIDGDPKAPQSSRSAPEREESAPSSSGVSDKVLDRKRTSDADTTNVRAAGRGCSRTPRQQEQNKQAQQRYRERRKMKVVEMESQLNTAQQQVSDLQSVLKQNVALQDKTLALERRLAEKNKECQQLKAEASRNARTWGGALAADAARQSADELRKDLQDCIAKLEAMADEHRLRDEDVQGAAGLNRQVLEEVKEEVTRCVKLRQQAEAEGLETGSLRANTALQDTTGPAKWAPTLQDLRLDEFQVNQLVTWHQGHLSQLRSLAGARHLIVHKIQETDRAQQGQPGDGGDPSHDGFTAAAALRTGSLLKHIRALEENLQKEGKLAQQFSYVVVTRILSPVQAALLALDAWPAFCDCLALTAALAAGQAGEGPAP